MRTIQFVAAICALSGSLALPACDDGFEDPGAMGVGEARFEDDVFVEEAPAALPDDAHVGPAALEAPVLPACEACSHFEELEGTPILQVLPPALVAVPGATQPAEPSEPPLEPPSAPEVAPEAAVVVDGISLYWTLDGDVIHFKVIAETTGWIGVAFDPSYKLKGADVVVGSVSEDGVTIHDGYGTDAESLEADDALGGADDILAAQGSEEGGVTTILFTLALDSGDAFDTTFAPGESMVVGLVAGPDGDDAFAAPFEILGFGVFRL